MFKKAHNLVDWLPPHRQKYRIQRLELGWSAPFVESELNLPKRTIYKLEYGQKVLKYYKHRVKKHYEEKLASLHTPASKKQLKPLRIVAK